MSAERPKTIATTVRIEKELSILPHLDGWTLDELHEFEDDGFHGDGQDVLVGEARVIDEDVEDFEIDRKAFAQYVAWREANGLVSRTAVADAQRSEAGDER